MGTVFDVNSSRRLTINLATAGDILTWSNGEVKKPETINYRTLKPEKDGLFCEKIFGPTKDWECYCGKYKRVRFKGIICERCGVEVTRSKVRRERMGHIQLAAPVTHIWYFKGVPSRLGYLLDIAPKSLEKVIYFAAHLITWVDTERLHKDLPSLEAEMKAEIGDVEREREVKLRERDEVYIGELEELEGRGAKKNEIERAEKAKNKDFEDIRLRYEEEIGQLKQVWDTLKAMKPKQLIDDERVWRELVDRYHDYFAGGMGAEAVKDLVSRLDLDEVEVELKETIATAKGQRKAKAIKRLKVVSAFNRRDDDGRAINSPLGMILDVVPVIPPDLRPMVQLDGGRFATSDLNDLYRRVINRNNRLKRLLDLGAPEIIINNEKRMLQEAVDALFDNGRRGRPVTGPGNRALKSLSDMLKGKQGRFRQNLLGKRVDYSGRSVIVVGPQLRLQQCGLPKQMALELFKPFVMKRLVDLEYAQNIKSAKRMVERARPQVWDVLEEVIKEHPVFLNRAPTLHRLGIQAFEPVLVEGKAIQIHPLVCAAFNADFDGDQMAVHLPLSAEAQAEARMLMLAAHNILSPASGRPIAVPSQDMIIGLYYLSEALDGLPGEGRVFRSLDEAFAAYEERFGGDGETDRVARQDQGADAGRQVPGRPVSSAPLRGRTRRRASCCASTARNGSSEVLVETSLGRLLLNSAFPDDFPFVDRTMRKRDITEVVGELVVGYDKAVVANSLDRMKTLGYEWSTRSGLTISIADVTTPPAKAGLLEKFEGEAAKVESQYERGIITDDERRQQEIEIWTDATNQVTKAMQDLMQSTPFNPIDMMVGSGARGNIMQVRQIAGMRGLVANPRGEIIPRPIKSNFREGLSVLEYFISTHGARKGLADTALAYRRLRLPDASTRRRGAGAHRARVGLRDEPWHLGRGRAPRPRVVARARDEPARPLPHRGRDADRRHGDPAQRRDRRRRDAPARRRREHHARCACARCSRARPCRVSARSATAACWPPARSPISARRSASSPRSRSVSRARSSPCVRSTPVVSRARTSRTVCRAWSSCSRPGRRRRRRCSRTCRVSCGSARTRRASASSRSCPTTAPSSSTRCRAGRTSRCATARRSPPVTAWSATTRARSTRRSSSRSRACARPSSTSSTRCSGCTATRACRSTTSTSR